MGGERERERERERKTERESERELSVTTLKLHVMTLIYSLYLVFRFQVSVTADDEVQDSMVRLNYM